ncbi:MAG: dihydroorotase [Planctomycetes bacterium]|nr:dihydroorotase [Planctomycetota bacterium]
MGALIIKNGHVFDPSQNLDLKIDILIRNGVFEKIGSASDFAADGIESFDAEGMMVFPGLIDMHVHFREPGMEAQETVASGSAAAVAGGFTSVACMPNTDPALDSEAAMGFVYKEAEKAGLANVFPMGAITAGRKGEELAEMGQMAAAGAVAFTDDGTAVPTAGLLRRAMSYAKMLGKPIVEHCEDPSLSGSGAMNEGYVSTSLGLPGIPSESEEVIVARDVALARLTGAHLHVQHISTRGSVEIIRRAKAEGINVTAEVTPHHLVLTDECIKGYDPNFKVSPPLRSQDDINACIEGLKDGTIEVIASDHAPHLAEAKELEFQFAPCGILGLEATVGVLYNELIHTGKLTLKEMIPAMTTAPSDIININRGRIKCGLPADITVIDPNHEWTIDANKFKSKSRNCPYNGRAVKGKTVATIVAGNVVYKA